MTTDDLTTQDGTDGAVPTRGSPGDAPPAWSNFTDAPVAMWFTQVFIFLVGGVAFLFPRWTFDLFIGRPPPAGEPIALAHDLFALLGAHASSVGVLTVLALMVGAPVPRRRFSIVFSFFLLAWISVLVWNLHDSPERYGLSSRALVPAATIMLLANLRAVLRRVPGDDVEETRGQVAAAPGWTLFVLVIIALAALAHGIVVLTMPESILRLWVRDPAQVTALAVQQYRFTGAYLVCFAAASVFCASLTRYRSWRLVAVMLAHWPFAVIVIAMIRAGTNAYTIHLWLGLLPMALIGIGALVVARARTNPWASDISAGIPGWTPMDLLSGPMMALQGTGNRRRASHLVGVGARGWFRTPDAFATGVPENRFFEPGLRLPCVVRFANLTELDDASLDVRGAALAVTDPARGLRFDMVMNTGSSAPVRDVIDFALFVGSKFLPTFASKLVVQSDATKREGAITGVRRAPESFTKLYFHSQIVRWWFDRHSGAVHLVRYRIAPDDLAAPESGLPGPEDAKHVWLRDRVDGDTRPTDYLRKEFKSRFDAATNADGTPALTPVRMRFQAQYHPDAAGLGEQFYDASVDWPEHDHPWFDVGFLELESALPDEVTETLDFWPGFHPPGLGVPPSSGPFDPRSLGDSEVRVMLVLQRYRRWLGETFGRPTPRGTSR